MATYSAADMYDYGVRSSRFALMASEPSDGNPTYSEYIPVGSMSAFKTNIERTSVSAYGDDVKRAELKKVNSCNATWAGYGIPKASAVKLFGHKQGDDGVEESFSDVSPYVGYGCIQSFMTGDGALGFRSHFYPKGVAAQDSVEMTTAGENIELRTVSADMSFVEPKGAVYHQWDEFTGEDAETKANAWLDSKFNIQAQ